MELLKWETWLLENGSEVVASVVSGHLKSILPSSGGWGEDAQCLLQNCQLLLKQGLSFHLVLTLRLQ